MNLTWTDSLETVNWDELAALYRAAPLGDRAPEELRTAFTNSRFRWFVLDGDQLVASGRALADGVDCSYVCDIAVLPSHQGRGLGKALVRRLVEQSRGHRKILLYAVPGREPLYHQLGFRRMKTAMAIFPDPDQALARGLIEA
jgi:ribosomal protein S18 acetylase RimI-like enzyme